MEISFLKEACIENCESIYALAVTYLKNIDNDLLKKLLENLNVLENNIRKCNDKVKLDEYIVELNKIADRIEGIINE